MVTRRSGKVVDLGLERARRLAGDLAPRFEADGQIIVPMADIADVDDWRRACRLAASRLGRHVRTGVTSNRIAWAVIEDHPAHSATDLQTVTRALLDL